MTDAKASNSVLLLSNFEWNFCQYAVPNISLVKSLRWLKFYGTGSILIWLPNAIGLFDWLYFHVSSFLNPFSKFFWKMYEDSTDDPVCIRSIHFPKFVLRNILSNLILAVTVNCSSPFLLTKWAKTTIFNGSSNSRQKICGKQRLN